MSPPIAPKASTGAPTVNPGARGIDGAELPSAWGFVTSKAVKKKILIAEDTRLIATAIYDQLASDYEVTLCFDGKQAASRALEEAFDLIVTDIVMPEMDGIELARVLRNQDATKDIPIIALSTKAEEVLNAETRRQFTAYLVKPFGLDELPRIVHEIFNKGEAAQ